MSPHAPKKIFLVSDGTGETAAAMVKAAMVQFEDQIIEITRFKNVRDVAQMDAILEEAESAKGMIIYTIAKPQIRAHLAEAAAKKSVPIIDILGPILTGLAGFFGFEPRMISGVLHIVDAKYFKRIEAMEYTIQHDDGRDLTNLQNADLIIMGISRTSKTPLSMYLSQQGWKVVNIPIINGFEVPKELEGIDPRKVIGLTIDPEDLTTIRRNRLNRLGQDKGGEYADPEKVNHEISYADEIFKKNRRWAIFNVTGKALEETAAEIIRLMASRRLTPLDSFENTPSIK